LKSPTIKVAELGVEGPVGDVAAGRDIDILDPQPAVEPCADVPCLAIVLPVVAQVVVERQLRHDRHAMMHLLPVEQLVTVAQAMEQLGREDRIHRLGFLQAQYVGRFLAQQPLDDPRAGTNRINVPRGDFKLGHGCPLSVCEERHQPTPPPDLP